MNVENVNFCFLNIFLLFARSRLTQWYHNTLRTEIILHVRRAILNKLISIFLQTIFSTRFTRFFIVYIMQIFTLFLFFSEFITISCFSDVIAASQPLYSQPIYFINTIITLVHNRRLLLHTKVVKRIIAGSK